MAVFFHLECSYYNNFENEVKRFRPGGDGHARDGPSGCELLALKPNPKAKTLAREGVFRLARNRQDFEPAIWNREARSKLPGMLAQVDAPDGALRRCGGLVHRLHQTPRLEFAVGPQALQRNGANE
jgi:hypothetical protein